MNLLQLPKYFSLDLDFYYVAFNYIYAVEFFVYTCTCTCMCHKLSILYTCICRYCPKLPCQRRQNVLSIFLWICSSGYGVQVNVYLYNTSNEPLFPWHLVHIIWCDIIPVLIETLLHPMLTCTFHLLALPSGLWQQGSHSQGCDIRALFTVRAVTSGLSLSGAVTSGLSLLSGLWVQGLRCRGCDIRALTVRAVASGLSLSGLWHQGSYCQGCDIKALTVRAVTTGLSPSGLWHQGSHHCLGCDIRALLYSALLWQGLMIFLIKWCFFSFGI